MIQFKLRKIGQLRGQRYGFGLERKNKTQIARSKMSLKNKTNL